MSCVLSSSAAGTGSATGCIASTIDGVRQTVGTLAAFSGDSLRGFRATPGQLPFGPNAGKKFWQMSVSGDSAGYIALWHVSETAVLRSTPAHDAPILALLPVCALPSSAEAANASAHDEAGGVLSLDGQE